MDLTIKGISRQEGTSNWVYHFESMTSFNYGFFAYVVGCERGTLYSWVEFGRKGFGTDYLFSITRKFSRKRISRGTCRNHV